MNDLNSTRENNFSLSEIMSSNKSVLLTFPYGSLLVIFYILPPVYVTVYAAAWMRSKIVRKEQTLYELDEENKL